ncbi:MAG: hypothetical protein ACI9WU_003125 [Myxococcota bacterium]|jgi:hypothetical protein
MSQEDIMKIEDKIVSRRSVLKGAMAAPALVAALAVSAHANPPAKETPAPKTPPGKPGTPAERRRRHEKLAKRKKPAEHMQKKTPN